MTAYATINKTMPLIFGEPLSEIILKRIQTTKNAITPGKI